MQPFTFLDHTADVGIAARGSSWDELFRNAALGMFSLIADTRALQCKEEIAVDVTADDRDSLLVVFLNEILYQYETKHIVFCECLIFTISETRVVALCKGEKRASSHYIQREIKAATYHQLKIQKNQEDKVYEAQIIFDV